MAATPSARIDRKSTRLNSSHGYISYAVFFLKKNKAVVAGETLPDRGGEDAAARFLGASRRSPTRAARPTGPRRKPSCFRPPAHVFFNDTATTEISTLSLHDALPIWISSGPMPLVVFLVFLLLGPPIGGGRSEEHTPELQFRLHGVCRLLLGNNI